MNVFCSLFYSSLKNADFAKLSVPPAFIPSREGFTPQNVCFGVCGPNVETGLTLSQTAICELKNVKKMRKGLFAFNTLFCFSKEHGKN